MRTTRTIKLGPFAPDLSAVMTDEPFLVEAKNVIPTPTGYEQFHKGASYITRDDHAFTTPICGALHLGNDILLASKDKIKRVTTTGNTDLTRTSADYHCPAHEPWRIVKFGNTVIACNGSDFAQKWHVVDDTNFTDLATDFVPSEVAIVRDFVVFGYIESGTSAKPQGNLLKWSAINDPTDYTPSVTTQSDEQLLPGENQEILKIIGGEVGYIFTRSSIWRMTYIGSPNIFQFDEIQTKLPYLFRHSIVDTRNGIYMLGGNGIYRFDKQSEQLTPVNKGYLDNYIKTRTIDKITTALGGQREQGLIRGIYYADKDLIIWSFDFSIQSGLWPNATDAGVTADSTYCAIDNLCYSLDTDSCTQIQGGDYGFMWFTGYEPLIIESITAGADTFDDIGDQEILDSGNSAVRNKLFFVTNDNIIFEFDNNGSEQTEVRIRTNRFKLFESFCIVHQAVIRNTDINASAVAGFDTLMPIIAINSTNITTGSDDTIQEINSSSYPQYYRLTQDAGTLGYGNYFYIMLYSLSTKTQLGEGYKFTEVELEFSPHRRRALEASY